MTHIRTSLVTALVGAATLLVAACGGTPAASPLSDPAEILTAAVTATSEATSFHVDVSADGQLSLDLMGTGAAAPISLTGTTATADVDIANAAAHATFSMPGMLGLAGEVIAIDGSAYVKTTLTGPLYQKQSLADAGAAIASPDPSAVASMIAELDEALAKPGVDPVKGADVECGTKTCYTVTIELTAEELAALNDGEVPTPSGLPIPIPLDLGDATVNATFRVEQDTNRLAGVTLTVGMGESGTIDAELTFSKWNESVSIAAPSADQVQGG